MRQRQRNLNQKVQRKRKSPIAPTDSLLANSQTIIDDDDDDDDDDNGNDDDDDGDDDDKDDDHTHLLHSAWN